MSDIINDVMEEVNADAGEAAPPAADETVDVDAGDVADADVDNSGGEQLSPEDEALLSIFDDGLDEVLPMPEEGTHKDLRPLQDLLEVAHPDVGKHLANFRADYTRKTQALAQEKKDFYAQMEKEKEEFYMERERWMKVMETPASEVAKEKDEQGVSTLDKMKDMHAEQVRQSQINQFVDSKPEFADQEFGAAIVKMVSEGGYTVENAYYTLKGKMDEQREAAKRKEAEKEARRDVAARATRPTTKRGNRRTPPPKGYGADINDWVLKQIG